MNIVQTSRTVGLSIGLIAASAVLVPISVSAQDLYVGMDGEGGTGIILKFTPSGSSSWLTSSFTGMSAIDGIAVDSSGNLFVANYGYSNINFIKKVTPSGAISNFATTGFSSPADLAFDSSGNLFVSNVATSELQDGFITKISPSGAVSNFATGLEPYSLAIDANDNLFVSTVESRGSTTFSNVGSIKKFASDGTSSTFAAGLFDDLAFDSNGTLFAVAADNSIKKFASDGTFSTFAAGFSSPNSLAIDSSDNLFTIDNFGIKKITSSGVVSTFSSFRTLGAVRALAFAPSASALNPTAVPEPFTIIGTLIGGTAALRMRKKLKSSGKE